MLELAVLDRYIDEIAVRLERRLQLKPHPANAKRLFTVPEAAEYLGRSENAVKLLIHRGKLPVTKIDTKVQLDRAALEKLISDCTFYETVDHRT